MINAHLLYGDKDKQKDERELEFKALLAWLIDRARERGRTYGMFDFVRLFFETFPSLETLPKRSRYSKFEHDVSDHMPIWIRLPRPYIGQPEFTWA